MSWRWESMVRACSMMTSDIKPDITQSARASKRRRSQRLAGAQGKREIVVEFAENVTSVKRWGRSLKFPARTKETGESETILLESGVNRRLQGSGRDA